MKNRLLILPLALLPLACATTSSEEIRVVEADAAVREPLFKALAALEGNWQTVDEEGTVSPWKFEVTSGGSVVQETMAVGTEHQMTNIYTLEGNGISMMHFCAGGNQPRMHATAMDGNSIPFEYQGVYDLKESDEVFMGEMTLVFVDDNTIEQHWKGLRQDGEDAGHDNVMKLTRR